MQHVLRVLDHTGDTAYEWEGENDGPAVAVAERTFDEKIGQGFAAFEMETPTVGKQVKALNRKAPETILVPQYEGG
jgi:hypothetical protein